MLYSQIVGQNEPKHRLLKMVHEGRVPHACGFREKKGVAICQWPLPLRSICIVPKQQKMEPAALCISCNKVAKLVHPDLHLVFPIISRPKEVEVSKDVVKEFREAFLHNPYLTLNDWNAEQNAENKQPLISVKEANEILRKISYTSFEGSYKIMVIWQPEKMNIDASNKLLKILEEPPEKTIFILVANHPEQLLVTILSRVQQIPFYACTEQEVVEALMRDFKVNSAKANEVALIANGNFSEAISLLKEMDEGVSLLNHFQAFMRLALKFDATKALAWIDENATTGAKNKNNFLQYALEVFRDALMFNFGDKRLIRLSGSERAFLEKFAPFINQKNYEKLVEEFNGNYYYVERNANPKILFMDLLLKTNELINMK